MIPSLTECLSCSFQLVVKLGCRTAAPFAAVVAYGPELVIEIAGTGVEIVQARPLPEDDPLQRQPDITLAREKLGWEPRIALREGLQRTVDWFRDADLSQYRPPTPHY